MSSVEAGHRRLPARARHTEQPQPPPADPQAGLTPRSAPRPTHTHAGRPQERFDEIVDFAGVGEYIDMPLRTYSSGMNSRLRFSIAAAVEPDILLIDEALAVGDASFRAKSQARMRQLVERAGALVLVSHSLGSITEMCTRVIWMHRGEVQLDGPADEVLDAYVEFTRRR